MFWDKSTETDFERAKKAYYQCCYRKGIIPIRPIEQLSEIDNGFVLLKNKFNLVAKVFFVERSGKIKKRAEQANNHSPRVLALKEYSG